MRPPAACIAARTSAAARSLVTYSLPFVVYRSSSPRSPRALSLATSSTTFLSDKCVCSRRAFFTAAGTQARACKKSAETLLTYLAFLLLSSLQSAEKVIQRQVFHFEAKRYRNRISVRRCVMARLFSDIQTR